MPAWMLVSHNALEILFTPDASTMLGESDGNRLRRIYTDGRPHPADPDPSFHGHSIGPWEGETLVVDTVGCCRRPSSPSAKAVGVPEQRRLCTSVERIHLAGADVLVDELAITAPNVLTHTWMTTRRFTRRRDRTPTSWKASCLQGSFAEADRRPGRCGVRAGAAHRRGEPGAPASAMTARWQSSSCTVAATGAQAHHSSAMYDQEKDAHAARRGHASALDEPARQCLGAGRPWPRPGRVAWVLEATSRAT
jgi:hypothetical protein